MHRFRRLLHSPLFLTLLFISGCAVVAEHRLNTTFGAPEVRVRTVTEESVWAERYRSEIKPIIDNRCVVCHACYDAPCQLKLSSPEGIDRGASKELVYDGARVLSAEPSRLLVDEQDTQGWRDRGFTPVLNEREQTPVANREGSLIYQLLLLKTEYPATDQPILPESFDLALNRDQVCSGIEAFEQYKNDHPQWGMPYGLPPISANDLGALSQWLEVGAPMPATRPLPKAHQQAVSAWEQFFNQPSLKAQLSARYLYEHLFLAHFYFDQLPLQHPATGERLFFTLVRSSTPPGEPIDVIATRRPYDDPGVERVFYRLQLERESISVKTHMPYALNDARQQRWQSLFLEPSYQVDQLPSYEPHSASNPFATFQAIPVASRYRFLLDEAQYTIMGFIKGPVCRGQIALNVINDNFWVFFTTPELYEVPGIEGFFAEQIQHLKLPAENQDIFRPLKYWQDYSESERNYLLAKYRFLSRLGTKNNGVPLELVWDGDGVNDNAALTVFRHFDSATVEKGLLGQPPQTAWLIGYPTLERIHYLLVAGFDVYGNVGHQLLTRLYMDFLRMESEFNFLTLLPREFRVSEWHSWYQGANRTVLNYMAKSDAYFSTDSAVAYQQADNGDASEHKQELYQLLKQRLSPVLNQHKATASESVPAAHRALFEKMRQLPSPAIQLTAQLTLLSIQEPGQTHLYSVLHNNAHSNISSLLNEDSNRTPEDDSLSIIKGLAGSYPGAFWSVKGDELSEFLTTLQQLQSEADYAALMARFGVRRTSANFWQHADLIHRQVHAENQVTGGLLDFNRLENR